MQRELHCISTRQEDTSSTQHRREILDALQYSCTQGGQVSLTSLSGGTRWLVKIVVGKAHSALSPRLPHSRCTIMDFPDTQPKVQAVFRDRPGDGVLLGLAGVLGKDLVGEAVVGRIGTAQERERQGRPIEFTEEFGLLLALPGKNTNHEEFYAHSTRVGGRSPSPNRLCPDLTRQDASKLVSGSTHLRLNGPTLEGRRQVDGNRIKDTKPRKTGQTREAQKTQNS